jgi:uncharacterized protein
MSADPPLPVSILWRRLDSPGHDAATLSAIAGGWRLEGVAAFLEAGDPCQLSYQVVLDQLWQTRTAEVHGRLGATPIDLQIATDARHEWRLNGREVRALAGCVDVDLAFTPATNLLPIRRLDLPVGASARVVAAWLPFPDLDLRPLDQVYRRSAPEVYEYSSSGGTFQATLSVSPVGFVTHYSGLWLEERV